MADPWGTEGTSGYLPGNQFKAAMDNVYGAGKWRETGAWRSQARENQLRAQGAQTVAAGAVSPHSLGNQGAPGAYDISVDGLTPAQAAAKLKAAGLPIDQLYPEGAAGGQGAHLHVAMHPGATTDPWAVSGAAAADPWGTPAASSDKQTLLQSAGRIAGSALGGVLEGAASTVKGAGQAVDAWLQAEERLAGQTGFAGGATLTPEERTAAGAAGTNRTPVVAPAAAKAAAKLDQWGVAVEPTNRSTVESLAHGAGGFVAPIVAAAVDPLLGAATFGAQGFGETYDEAIAKGASPETAEKAATESGALQAGIGMVPFGKVAEPVIHGIANPLLAAGARIGAESAGGSVMMGAMQTGENMVAQQNYDPDRPLTQNVPKAMLQGALASGAIHAVGEAGSAARNAVAQRLRPAEQPVAAPVVPQGMPEAVAAQAYQEMATPAPVSAPDGTLAPLESDGALAPEPAPAEPVAPPPAYEEARVSEGAPVEQMPAAIADVSEFQKAAPKGYNLFQAMKDLGGIRNRDADGKIDGDVAAAFGEKRLPPGLINNKTGLTPDGMREALQQRGWFGAFDQSQGAEADGWARPGDDINDLYDLIDQHVRTGPVLHPETTNPGHEERRDAVEAEMGQAGVALKDTPEEAAAKLAAYRAGVSRESGPDMEELRQRAIQSGVPHVPGMTYDELLGDVVERDAIAGEYDGAAGDHDEGLIDAVLTPEEHEWLAAPERGARGEQVAPGEASISGESGAFEPYTPAGYRELGEGAGGGGEGARAVPEGAQLGEAPTERVNLGHETVDQGILPGTEQSALQAALARGETLRPKVAQQDAGGLFAPPEPEQNELKFQRSELQKDAQTPVFKRWFGDSKVVDADGKPLIVYHGTNQPIDQFSRDRLGANTKAAPARHGFFFTSEPDIAAEYAAQAGRTQVAGAIAHEAKTEALKAAVEALERAARQTGKWEPYEAAMQAWEDHEAAGIHADDVEGQNIVPAYLSIKNPLEVDMKRGGLPSDIDDVLDAAKAAGHDGAILRNIADPPPGVSDHYIAFEPEQIKSPMNVGTFSPTDADILYQRSGSAAAPTPPELLTEIAARYTGGDSYRTIRDDLRVSTNTINRALKERGVPSRPKIGSDDYRHPATKDEATADEVVRLYVDEKLAADDIAKRLDISQPAASRIIRKRGLTRTPSEQMVLRDTMGRSQGSRGIFGPWQSTKDGSWHYAHSTYEMARMHQLDGDPEVESYTKKTPAVPMPDGTRYQPDLLVRYKDGRVEVEEIKPSWRAAAPDVVAKAREAEKFFADRDISYRVVGAPDIGRAAFEELRDNELGSLSDDDQARARKSIAATLALPEMRETDLALARRQAMAAPGDYEPVTRGLEGVIAPEKASALVDEVAKIIQRLAPKATPQAYASLRDKAGGSVEGAMFRDGAGHVIAWALDSADAARTARHEAIHALRSAKLFKPAEWGALASAAASDGWLDHYHIAERYPDLSAENQIEEAVAEKFADWRADQAAPSRLPSFVKALFQRIKSALDGIAYATRQALGKAATAEDIFRAIERGDVGSRSPTGAPAPAETRFARKTAGDDAPEALKARGVINKALGEGVDAIGHKINRAAGRFLPDPLIEIGEKIRMGLNPMAAGSERAMASAKDFANVIREHTWEWGRIDRWIEKTFTPEQRQAMWSAADEESVIRQGGREPGPGEGLNKLEPAERTTVLELQARANTAFDQARQLGMTKADALPSYVPRMVVEMSGEGAKRIKGSGDKGATGSGVGRNLQTTSAQLKHRKYLTAEETEAAAKEAFGEGATVVKDIRTLALATGKLEQAVAGRRLIQQIKEAGASTGETTVSEGAVQDPQSVFTIDHPAMKVWRPKFTTDPETGKLVPIEDPATGRPVMEQHPLYVSKEFEGPLKAVLTQPSGALEQGLMALKGKTMSVIMYSPLLHNAVIWGKAFAADPKGVLTFDVYRQGYQAKTDPATMREAIRAGLDPIGKKYFNQDITAIASPPQIEPGQSWTAKLIAGLVSAPARVAGRLAAPVSRETGTALTTTADALSRTTKESIDKLGDLWHNTFLWDRVGDLQMGLYTHMRDSFIKHGADPQTAQRVAAHYANRYAGALPIEAMSKMARNTANLMLFSRSFTMTNLGAWKDAVAGLPPDIQAQIKRDKGLEALRTAQGTARGKAVGLIAMDIALARVGLILASSAVWGVYQMLNKPQPAQFPWENEKGKENRFFLGYQPDGTAIYGRLPTGKVAEDLQSWVTQPMTTSENKLSPYAKTALEIASNDKGFGRKLYDPYDKTFPGFARNVGRVVTGADLANLSSPDDFTGGLLGNFTPVGLVQGVAHLGNKSTDPRTAMLQVALPLFGITVSKGAPGGPAMGDLYRAQDEHSFHVAEQMSGIKTMIKAGQVQQARAKMSALGIAPGLQGYYVRTTLNPAAKMSGRALADFMRYATPEDKALLQQDRDQAQARRQAGVAP